MSSSKPINFSKPVQTKGGLSARVLCTDMDGGCAYPVVVLVKEGKESTQYYTLDGSYYTDGETSPMDLVNVPETTEIFFNLYADGDTYPYNDNLAAALGGREYSPAHTVATVKVTFSEDGKHKAEIV